MNEHSQSPLQFKERVLAKLSPQGRGYCGALVALGIVIIAAGVLLLDVVTPAEAVQLNGAPDQIERGVIVHLTLKGSSQSLDASPTLVVAPIEGSFVDFDTQKISDKAHEQCFDEVLLAANAARRLTFVPAKNSDETAYTPTTQLGFDGIKESYSIGSCIALKLTDEGPVHMFASYPSNLTQVHPDYPIDWRSDNGSSLFPFDVWRGTLAVAARTHVDEIEVRYFAPSVVLSSTASNWQVSAWQYSIGVDESLTIDGNVIPGSATIIGITLHRPLSVQLFTIFLLLAVLALEIAIYFIADHNTAVGAVIGVIFGLWSIHELLVPLGMPAVNLVRSIILFLYVVLIVVAFLRFFVKPLLQAANHTDVVVADAAEPSEVSSLDH